MSIFGWGKKVFLTEEKYNENLEKQLILTPSTLHVLEKHGVAFESYLKLEFFFITNKKAKARHLATALRDKDYSIEQIQKNDKGDWFVSGWSTRVNMSKYSMLVWTQEMCEIGFKFDCSFDGWGTLSENNEGIDVDEKLTGDQCYNRALDLYKNGQYLEALSYFSVATKQNPKDFEAFYSRAVTKSALNNKEGAIADYSKAIDLKPDYESALVNRAAERDDLGDHQGAIEDYDAVLKIKPESALAYLNRGNSFYYMEEMEHACQSWKAASLLGDETATE